MIRFLLNYSFPFIPFKEENLEADLNEEKNLFLVDQTYQHTIDESNQTIDMKIGYKQQLDILYRDDSSDYDKFQWWLPPINRRQVLIDENSQYTSYILLRRSIRLKQRQQYVFVVYLNKLPKTSKINL